MSTELILSIIGILGASNIVPIINAIKSNKSDDEINEKLDNLAEENARQNDKINNITNSPCVCVMESRLDVLEMAELSATAYRLNETIDKINNKLDIGDKEISGNVVNLVKSLKVYHDMGGNGDFRDKYNAVIERIKMETPEIYTIIKGLE